MAHRLASWANGGPCAAGPSILESFLWGVRSACQTRSRKANNLPRTLSSPATRAYRTFVRLRCSEGKRCARIPLTTSVYGQVASRGTRPYQEDTWSVSCLEVPTDHLRKSLLRDGRISTEAERNWHWDTEQYPADEAVAGQVNWWGVFDGHGGGYASRYLADYLHQIFENVEPDMVTHTVQFTREHGGYFRRFTGGALERWTRHDDLRPFREGRSGRPPTESTKAVGKEQGEERPSSDRVQTQASALNKADMSPETGSGAILAAKKIAIPNWDDNGLTRRISPPEGMQQEVLSLSERATLAFLVADHHILTCHQQPSAERRNGGIEDTPNIHILESVVPRQGRKQQPGGSTASVLMLHSLDAPPSVWYDSQFLFLGSWHVGDTRMLLCPTADGKAIPLTKYHHPDSLSESERLRRLGAGVITDSFGEARWMGALANTRAIGDGEFKAAGVTAEPEVLSQVIRSENYSHVTLFSDGISSVMSDQEVVDLARGCRHPQEAAQRILTFAEELGVEDNATVVVVPLKGWAKSESCVR